MPTILLIKWLYIYWMWDNGDFIKKCPPPPRGAIPPADCSGADRLIAVCVNKVENNETVSWVDTLQLPALRNF